jgi:excisionase family DNA binding protein
MSAISMTREQYYTADEVAQILRVSVRTVHRLIKRGELEAFTIDRDYRIPQSALDNWIARRTRPRKET